MGGSSDLVLTPGGTLVLGAVAGTISVFGFAKMQSFLRRTIGLDDSCGKCTFLNKAQIHMSIICINNTKKG